MDSNKVFDLLFDHDAFNGPKETEWSDIDLAKKLISIYDNSMDDMARNCSYGEKRFNLIDCKNVFRNGTTSTKEDLDDGFNYLIDAFYYQILGFCGCGNPNGILEYILEILNLFTDDPPATNFFSIRAEEQYKVLYPGRTDIELEFILKYLCSIGLTEHGTSVNSSWLTSKGICYRELLRRKLKAWKH